ncbi:MAG: ABC transporter substrate-binding protein [Pseudomonadota bacterium]
MSEHHRTSCAVQARFADNAVRPTNVVPVGVSAALRRIGRRLVPLWVTALLLLGPFRVDAGERVLTLGGSVTEIVFALGEQERLIGRDTTSSFPEAALTLPDVGYVRALSPEGVLSIEPDLIIAIEGSGPPEAVEVLKSAQVPWVTVPEGYDAQAVRRKIEVVAAALGVPDRGATLAAQIDAALADAIADASNERPPKVMFVLTMMGGRIMAAGAETSAEGIIRLAGGVNAMEGFEGYKQVSEEAVLAAAPDVILMMDRGGHAVSDADIVAHPALGQTPAAAKQAIVRLPGLLLLGFGPRTPQAVQRLSEALRAVQG